MAVDRFSHFRRLITITMQLSLGSSAQHQDVPCWSVNSRSYQVLITWDLLHLLTWCVSWKWPAFKLEPKQPTTYFFICLCLLFPSAPCIISSHSWPFLEWFHFIYSFPPGSFLVIFSSLLSYIVIVQAKHGGLLRLFQHLQISQVKLSPQNNKNTKNLQDSLGSRLYRILLAGKFFNNFFFKDDFFWISLSY